MSRSGNYLMLTQELQKMKESGQEITISELARRTNLSRLTVRKYLNDGCCRKHASKGTVKGSKLDAFKPWLQSQFKNGNYNSANLYPQFNDVLSSYHVEHQVITYKKSGHKLSGSAKEAVQLEDRITEILN